MRIDMRPRVLQPQTFKAGFELEISQNGSPPIGLLLDKDLTADFPVLKTQVDLAVRGSIGVCLRILDGSLAEPLFVPDGCLMVAEVRFRRQVFVSDE